MQLPVPSQRLFRSRSICNRYSPLRAGEGATRNSLIKRITTMKTTSSLPQLLVFCSPLIPGKYLERKTVLKKSRFVLSSFGVMALGSIMAAAQAPVVSIDAQQHGELAQAQSNLVQAYSDVVQAQRNNFSHLGGHAQRAKDLISQANEELRLAADRADANERRQSPDATSAQPSPAAQAVSAAPVVTPDVVRRLDHICLQRDPARQFIEDCSSRSAGQHPYRRLSWSKPAWQAPGLDQRQ